MRTRERLALIAVLVLAAVFLFSIVRSVLRRTETTYNYPPYSSLNNGDEGTKAYFETLRKLGHKPSRNYQPLRKLEGTQAEIFYVGPGLGAFRYSGAKELEEFERLAVRGARIIIAFDTDGVVQKPRAGARTRDSSTHAPAEDTLKKRWGIQLAFTKRKVSKAVNEFMSQLDSIPVSWHFSSWANDWSPSQMKDSTPLFLERRFGKGSVLLIAESKLFTNRELLMNPDTQVLAAVPIYQREIIFDESHLGLEDTGTVVGLATAHGLQWMMLGLVVLAVLYVWRSSTSFVPPAAARRDTAVAGHDAHSALSNLLMQSLPKNSILGFVAEEWNRTLGGPQGLAEQISGEELSRLQHVQAVDVPTEYRSLAQKLKSRAPRSRGSAPP